MDSSRTDTREVYDEIAAHFAETRQVPWPEVTGFLEKTASGQVGLDIGCANGRHLSPLADRTDRVCGIDLSRSLLDIASEDVAPTVSLVQGDATCLPIATGSVDVALYIAALHHLPTRSDRYNSLAELARVLSPEGRALISAWSVAHDRFDRETGFDTTIDWTLPGGETVSRFYHIYDRGEFETLLAESPLSVLELEVSSGNYYATVTTEE
jgi:ubiquinone/menaquinone biosynthesis C-methylase UbiE